jgi:hypothetical protein
VARILRVNTALHARQNGEKGRKERERKTERGEKNNTLLFTMMLHQFSNTEKCFPIELKSLVPRSRGENPKARREIPGDSGKNYLGSFLPFFGGKT